MSVRKFRRQAKRYQAGRPTVYYVPEKPFVDRKGVQIVVGDEAHTTTSLLRGLIGAWQPMQGYPETYLKPQQIRVWQKLMDNLEAGPEDGYLALEDDRFNLAKSLVIPLMMNTSLRRDGDVAVLAHLVPQMEDLLAAAVTVKPAVAEEKA